MSRLWQKAMIGLARSSAMKRFMQGNRMASTLAGKYVAGKTAAEGVARALALKNGAPPILSSLFYLGEYVETAGLVQVNVEHKVLVAQELGRAGLDVHVSGDPTQIGFQLDRTLATENALRIAEAVRDAAQGRAGVHVFMLDMEDDSVIDATLALYGDLKTKGLPVAITVQAYLRRTENDLRRVVESGGTVRLVKGAFVAGPAIAFQRRDEIKANYRSLVEIMLSPEAKAAGCYPIIATHDDAIQEFAIALAQRNGWTPGEYEFEMLLGVRPALAESLARRGERVRLYVPFGEDWWPYAVRRIGEHPGNAILLARSLFS